MEVVIAFAVGAILVYLYVKARSDPEESHRTSSVAPAASAAFPEAEPEPEQVVLTDGLANELELEYSDAKADVTRRRVTLNRIVGEYDEGLSRPYRLRTIQAFCHLRGAQRTFRIDRIQELADLSTGEVLSLEDDNGQYLLWRYFADIVDGRSKARPFFDRVLADGRADELDVILDNGDVFRGTFHTFERERGNLLAKGRVTRIAGRRKWTGNKTIKDPDVVAIKHNDTGKQYRGWSDYLASQGVQDG